MYAWMNVRIDGCVIDGGPSYDVLSILNSGRFPTTKVLKVEGHGEEREVLWDSVFGV